MELKVSEVVDSLNQEQKEMLYYLVGYAREYGRRYLIYPGTFDGEKQKNFKRIYETLNEAQKTVTDVLINVALEDYANRTKSEED